MDLATKLLEAFNKDHDGEFTGSTNERLANAFREFARHLQGDGSYRGDAEERQFEIAEEVWDVADDLETLFLDKGD